VTQQSHHTTVYNILKTFSDYKYSYNSLEKSLNILKPLNNGLDQSRITLFNKAFVLYDLDLGLTFKFTNKNLENNVFLGICQVNKIQETCFSNKDSFEVVVFFNFVINYIRLFEFFCEIGFNNSS
jgi:hypothetical protein